MIIDSHCHLQLLNESPSQLAEFIHAAFKHDVGHLLSVCVDLESFSELQTIANSYPHVSISVGVHPTTETEHEPSTETLVKFAQHKKCIAIGETGLDYYRGADRKTEQQQRFNCHIEAAAKVNKPLIIHTRHAPDDTIAMLRSAQASPGIMHCFTESWEVAQQALDLGFYISFAGIVTFKNAKEVQDVAKRVPLDRILIETDSPFLAPVPFRGKPNQPAYVRYVAEKMAELRGISYEALATATSDNFFRLFPDVRSDD